MSDRLILCSPVVPASPQIQRFMRSQPLAKNATDGSRRASATLLAVQDLMFMIENLNRRLSADPS